MGTWFIRKAKAYGLLTIIQCSRRLHFTKVIFELDAKLVVDAISSTTTDVIEFGFIIKECKSLLSMEQMFSVCYIKRKPNAIAYALARETIFKLVLFFLLSVRLFLWNIYI
ncbi:hypothetical protein DITRI_Ditri13aG0060900 [Diplodiscus trichospermus]